jgi:hypothetical protein
MGVGVEMEPVSAKLGGTDDVSDWGEAVKSQVRGGMGGNIAK